MEREKIYICLANVEHDPSIVMFFQWKLYGIELERLARLKHCIIPEESNEFIKKQYFYRWLDYLFSIIWNYENFTIIWLGINIDENYFIDYPFIYSVYQNWRYLNNTDFLQPYWFFEEHHLLHGMSSYFSSSFCDSAILVLDSSWYDGEGWLNGINMTQSIYYGENRKIQFIEGMEVDEGIGIYGVGATYEMISDLIWLESWSVMGLSAYGDKNRFSDIELFSYLWKDVYFFKKGIQLHEMKEYLIQLYKIAQWDYKKKEDDITASIFADIAAHLQFHTEKAIRYLWNRAQILTQSKNICIAWWVGLNVLANTILLQECGFENIFVQSAVWDQWIALWWLYFLYYIIENEDNSQKGKIHYFPNIGKNYSVHVFQEVINNVSDLIEVIPYNPEIVVNNLIENKIIWCFHGSSEFWPRALWYRSILASPMLRENNLWVNTIKSRENWRPLAPIMLEEYFQEYISVQIKSPYMTLSSVVLPSKISFLAGVTHVDWTVRYQTVNKNENPRIHELISIFYKKTWVPALINTSLNVKSEPIVETPQEAMNLFLSTHLDALIFGDFFITKKHKKIQEECVFHFSENLLKICIDSQEKRVEYLRKWKQFSHLLFSDIDVAFTFSFHNRFSYKLYLWWNNYIVHIYFDQKKEGRYFSYKNISYNFSWDLNSSDMKLQQCIKNMNYIIIKYYEILHQLIS